jgi:TRAP transporter TAXI family solute receptor
VGSGTEATSRELFGVLGMDVARDIRPFMLGTGETASALQDRRIDAAILVGSLGMSAVVEITSLGLVDFLEVDDATFRSLKKVNETWVQFTIPANFYRNQPRPVRTYSGFNIISVRADLPEELAYQMTKTLFENKADLVAVRATMENMSLENVEKIEIPLHPGAARYYRERGLRIP